MGAAGVEGALDAASERGAAGAGGATEGALDAVVGDGLAAAGAENRHFLSVMLGASEPGLDPAGGGRGGAADQGDVAALDVVAAEKVGQALVGAV